MADLSYAFDGNKQASPDARKRVAAAMAGAPQQMPQDIGQGMQALGQALLQRRENMGAFPGAPYGSAAPSFGTKISNFLGLNRGGLY